MMTLNKIRAALLCGAAIGVMGLVAVRPAMADTPCVTSGTTLTCSGDQSEGISTGNPIATLNVLNLSQTIAPADGVDGIIFFSNGPITINSQTGWKGISVHGDQANGIEATSTTASTVQIDHVGNITSTDGIGIFATSLGDVHTASVSRIRAGSDGILVTAGGEASVFHVGSIDAADGSGISVTAGNGTITLAGQGNIDASFHGIYLDSRSVNEHLTLDWTGNVTAETGYGVYAYSSNGSIDATTVGDIDAYYTGLYLDSRSDTTTTLTYSHDGDISSEIGYGIYAYASNGTINGTSSGDIVSELDGLHLDSRNSSSPLVFSHDGDITSRTGYGVYAYSSGGAINATTNGDIDAELDGIFLDSRTTAATLTLNHTGAITSHTGNGVYAYSSNGSVDLTVNGAIDAELAGIYVYNPTGSLVSIVQNGDITSRTQQGIYAYAAKGAITITGSGAIDVGTDGIYAQAQSQSIIIDHGGAIDAGGYGIWASAPKSSVSVTNLGAISAVSDGIRAEATGAFGSGSATVDQTGDVTSTGGRGIYAHSTADGASVSSSGAVSAALDGIYVVSEGGGTTALIDHTGDITANGGYGAYAESRSGSTFVTVNGDIVASSDGIRAIGRGDTTTDVTVEGVGTILSTGGYGIYALATTGTLTVDHTGAIDAALGGIVATSTTDQTLTLNQFGDVIARDGDGIYGKATNGAIDAEVTGDVTATTYGVHLTSFNDIDLSIGGGTISGGSGYASVYFEQGLTNALTNYGTIMNADGVDGIAVLAINSDTTIDNYGRIVGDVDLYEWTNDFNNHSGALFEAGATVDLGDWNYLTNDGTFSPGGKGRVMTTSLTGGYVNDADGVFLVDIDMDAGTSDLVEVSDNADLSGKLHVNLLSFDRTPQTFTILTTGDVVSAQDLTLSQPVLLADITYPGNDQVDLTIHGANFNPAGLGGNPGAVGDHLTSAFYAGSPSLAPLFQGFLNLGTTAAVDDALRQLTPDVMLSAKLADLYGGLDFADGLMSCKVAGGAATFGAEGQCAWARARYDNLEVDGSADEAGFSQDTGEFSAGAQFAAEGDWRFGFALGAAFVDLESDGTDQQVDGTRVEGGVVAKYVPGPWLFAAAVSGTWGWYDSTRRVDFGGYSDTFSGSPEVGTLNGRLRAAYTAGDDGFYVRPQVDLNATVIHMSGFSESGGAGAIGFDRETDTIVSVAPAVEIGVQTDLGDGMLLRGFLKGGIDWFMDPEINVTGAFVEAASGAGDFTISTSPDDILWTVSVGADLFTAGGMTVRAAYDGKFGESTTDNAVSVKLSLDF